MIWTNSSLFSTIFFPLASARLIHASFSPVPIKNPPSFIPDSPEFSSAPFSLTTAPMDNGTCEIRLDTIEPYSVAESVFLALTLGLLIMVMIIGNILVITAIALEKELQRSQYYLILSLAVADLAVGVVVSPLAALYDINRQWHLGVPMCDFWIASDVLACTASILHLLAIALDRYWSITDVSYIQKRTPKRVAVMILIIWVISFCVSVAPILGWKDSQFNCRVEVRKECLISQAIGYQIFSTTTAFYGPLVLICILYWKIYKAAKKRIQMQVKRRSSTVSQLRAKILALQQNQENTTDPRRPTYRKCKSIEDRSCSRVNARPSAHIQILVTRSASNDQTAISVDNQSENIRNGQLAVHNVKPSMKDEYSSYYDDMSTIIEPSSACVPYQGAIPSILIATPPPSTVFSSHLSPTKLIVPDVITDDDTGLPQSPAPSGMDRSRTQSAMSAQRTSRLTTYTQTDTASTSFSSPPVSSQRPRKQSTTLAPVPSHRRKRFKKKESSSESSRERRAGRTLAIITGIFVVCWVPFFVLALVRPLCGGEDCPVPEPLNSVFLWLGYVNSAMNPIIYTIFSPDFRMAFVKTLQRFCIFKRL